MGICTLKNERGIDWYETSPLLAPFPKCLSLLARKGSLRAQQLLHRTLPPGARQCHTCKSPKAREGLTGLQEHAVCEIHQGPLPKGAERGLIKQVDMRSQQRTSRRTVCRST